MSPFWKNHKRSIVTAPYIRTLEGVKHLYNDPVNYPIHTLFLPTIIRCGIINYPKSRKYYLAA